MSIVSNENDLLKLKTLNESQGRIIDDFKKLI